MDCQSIAFAHKKCKKTATRSQFDRKSTLLMAPLSKGTEAQQAKAMEIGKADLLLPFLL